MPRISALPSLVVLGLLLAACGDEPTQSQQSVPSDRPTSTAEPTPASDDPMPLESTTTVQSATTTEQHADERETIRLTDFAIEMPEVISGPFIDLEVVNDGGLAHELAFAKIEPGTTASQVLDALAHRGDASAFLLGDPGGINLVGSGERLRYQRQLDAGSYVAFCPFPLPGGSSHDDAGMIQLFTVSASTPDVAAAVPLAEGTVTLNDDAIVVSGLEPGSRTYAITNAGATPHEVYILGFPAETDLTRTDEVGAWIEGGQVGPAPLNAHLPGGHQTIDPGSRVFVTMTMRADHTYLFEDYSGPVAVRTEVALS